MDGASAAVTGGGASAAATAIMCWSITAFAPTASKTEVMSSARSATRPGRIDPA